MKISVVIATYNGEDFIEKQLNSIKVQTLQPDEVLIYDDCSNDNTCRLVREYIKNNQLASWKFKVNKQNLGYKKNFYQLLRAAAGDIIFLSDQDDQWLPQKIEVMTKVMNQHPELESLNSLIQLIDQASNSVTLPAKPDFYNANFLHSKKSLERLNFFDWEKIIQRNISPGCSMCITKKIRDQFTVWYDYSLPHDWFLNLLAARTNGCGFLNEPLIQYRIHPQNTLGLSADPGSAAKMKKFEKNRQEKIKEFSGLIQAFANITSHLAFEAGKKEHAKKYLHARLNFYQKQNFTSLLKLRSFPEYYETATFKGRIWDIIIASHLKRVFYNL